MAKKLISDAERFHQSYAVSNSGCWEWQKARDGDGYGLFKVGSRSDGSRRMARVHRWSYEHIIGPIPDGLQIDHTCRNRCCCNPAHLEPVTGRENTQRGWRKSKTHCKSGHPLSGENLIVSPKGWRSCRTCQARWTRDHTAKTEGAAWKKYGQLNREKRRLAQAARRAAWSPEQLEAARENGRTYDRVRRPRKS